MNAHEHRTRRPRVALAAWATIALVALAGFGIASAPATDTPGFCRSACHEMEPYVDAWQEGPHAGVSCVECHVEPGTTARLVHKVTALGEVRSHFFGTPRFPSYNATKVPDERCVRCHVSVNVRAAGFDHARHATRGECQSCHATTGHAVSLAALEDAGILNESRPVNAVVDALAVADGGSANVPGHSVVTCSRCHDLARTGCATCHRPRHDSAAAARASAACDTCHKSSASFVFTHPVDTECASCHSTPSDHDYDGDCTSCHPKTGTSWMFAHPKGNACSRCHTRPANHRAGSCTLCHRAGGSWAYRHPASRSCASCHNAPSGHFGNSCASCHSVSRAWTSARFSHPRIRGGEHTYRSFACVKCHPSGYASATCLKCHNSNSGGDDDD